VDLNWSGHPFPSTFILSSFFFQLLSTSFITFRLVHEKEGPVDVVVDIHDKVEVLVVKAGETFEIPRHKGTWQNRRHTIEQVGFDDYNCHGLRNVWRGG